MPADIVSGRILPDHKVTTHTRTDERRRLPNRRERCRERIRAALITAAREFIATGEFNVPVKEITQAADVGTGSFYNHFDSKEQLFQAALQDSFDGQGTLPDAPMPVEDPAATFARSFRSIGRMFRHRPQESRVLLGVGLGRRISDRCLISRALRDITVAIRAGRFHVRDCELALTLAEGALIGLNQLLHDQPEREDAQAADRLAEDLLRVYGVPADEAREICRRPLPELDHFGLHDIFGVAGH